MTAKTIRESFPLRSGLSWGFCHSDKKITDSNIEKTITNQLNKDRKGTKLVKDKV